MKSFTLLITLFFISIAVQAQEFVFKQETIDYGKVAQGTNGIRTFEFTNTGKEPLIIRDIKSTCGCAIPKKPEKPIMPGQKGEIQVSYDTNRIGNFSKAITIISNAKKQRQVLKIRGIVTPKSAS
ncbi:DUF1573 domain-containing protein [Tenacibaculum sp. 190524A02b]|uniref:DUF1573 domain-containing protein n=1 Tax=Tenacibaculum vairaonense TaxID=3137860 RepID=A0ABP1FJP9_9FLAO